MRPHLDGRDLSDLPTTPDTLEVVVKVSQASRWSFEPTIVASHHCGSAATPATLELSVRSHGVGRLNPRHHALDADKGSESAVPHL